MAKKIKKRKWWSTPVLLPGKFHGLRSLVGYSPWGHKESNMTEWLDFTNERNQRHQKQMEGYFLFLGRKNQYWENDYTIKWYLVIQWDSCQIPNGIFHRTRTKNFTIHMEIQKTLNSQSSLEKEEWSWRNQAEWFHVILQSYSHQDSMVLAQKRET